MPVELNPITSGYSTGLINDNFQLVEDELNNNVLRRDGLSSGEANQMEVGLDMNSNFVYNLPEPVLLNQAARLQDVVNAIAGDTSANLIAFTPYKHIASTTTQGAIQEVIDEAGQLEVTTSTGTSQDLSEALDDRVNIGAVGTESITTETGTETVEEALDNRVVKNSQALNLQTRSTRRVDTGEFLKHKAFGVSLQTSDGTLFSFYRRADAHGLDESGAMYMTKSTDNGYSWSTGTLVYDDANRDIRNFGGCVTENDTILIWTEAVRTVGTADEEFHTSVLRSTDGGTSFSYSVESTSDTNRVIPHGRAVVIGSRVVQSFYRSPSQAFVQAVSTDDGLTWTITVPITTFPGTSSFTEPYLIGIGGDRIIGVARDNDADPTEALYFKSSDAGATWGTVTVWDNITLGRNPPMPWYSSETGMYVLMWPSRGSTRMSSGGTGELWPWYYSYGDADTLFDVDNRHMRYPTALPVYGPLFTDGNTEGDQGYGHVLDTPNGKMMVYHMGNNGTFPSTDLYMTNLSLYLEGVL